MNFAKTKTFKVLSLLMIALVLCAQQPINLIQTNGIALLTGNGVTGTGSPRVTIASDNTAFTVNAAQSGTWTVQPGNTANTTAWKVDGSAVTQPVNLTQIAGSSTVADPCKVNAKTYDSFSLTTNTQLITGTSAKKIYFCNFHIVVGAATNVAIVEGTGTVCATGIAKFPGMSGGTTAATGWNFAANGGLTYGSGEAALAGETTNADNVCILVSAANQTSGGYSYVVQ